MTEPLAHSAHGRWPAQSYADHVRNVVDFAVENARRAAAFLPPEQGAKFIHAVKAAACFHDLGKLDPDNQAALSEGRARHLPVNHVDAGVANLLEKGDIEPAVVIHSHHRGLANLMDEAARNDGFLRDDQIQERTDELLTEYVQAHSRLVGRASGASRAQQWSGLRRRFALSCMVDADHQDTAAHYGFSPVPQTLPGRWTDRLAALDAFVGNLFARDPASERNQLRMKIYQTCRDAPVSPPLRACGSPVGTGKTTAVMAHLLRVAEARDLRHIIIVLPFTNIITQSVWVYRDALTLPGERREEIVAEHHHLAEFEDLALRSLSTLWRAPITVTTAVQFFETLGTNRPSRLRKLHELAGSAVFIDETHAAIPSWMWPQIWLWIRELTEDWGGHFVFGSGSLARFWELGEFVNPPEQVPELVDGSLREEARQVEGSRIAFDSAEPFQSLGEFLDFVLSQAGPRLVIFNTIHSAAVAAARLRDRGEMVLHLSTALCPKDRSKILETIRRRLGEQDGDWTLVATSCVEAGVDFSFRVGFRETSSTSSLIQVGGRVNRHGSVGEKGLVWDFRVWDPDVRIHPALTVSRNVLATLLAEGRVRPENTAGTATEGLRREQMTDPDRRSVRFAELEAKLDYPGVAEIGRVIDADTRLVVVDPELADALEGGDEVDSHSLLKGSVQIWATRIERLDLPPLGGSGEIFSWPHEYDPGFLGYMAGVIGKSAEGAHVV